MPEYYVNKNDELTPPHSLIGTRMGWIGMQHAKWNRDMHTEYWSENVK